jgi:hypothetical protein
MTVKSAIHASRPLPPGRFLVLVSPRSWVDPRAIMRLEGLDQLKNLVTSSGIEPATFRLVAQCLNQPRYRISWSISVSLRIWACLQPNVGLNVVTLTRIESIVIFPIACVFNFFVCTYENHPVPNPFSVSVFYFGAGYLGEKIWERRLYCFWTVRWKRVRYHVYSAYLCSVTFRKLTVVVVSNMASHDEHSAVASNPRVQVSRLRLCFIEPCRDKQQLGRRLTPETGAV